jgi:N6-adenosine-specific RNA methylase IME4
MIKRAYEPEYPCISADPPWAEFGGGKIKRGADRHYPLIKKHEDILRVMVQAPCWRPAADSHLWLWVTNNFLPDGLWLMDALGYRYVTNRAWGKAEPIDDAYPGAPTLYKPQRPGLGQYLRGQHELLLFGVRGTLPARWKSMKKPRSCPTTLLLAPRGEHSKKPAEAYHDMQRVSPGPRLEMFARHARAGWDVWGNEVPEGRHTDDYCEDCGTELHGSVK